MDDWLLRNAARKRRACRASRRRGSPRRSKFGIVGIKESISSTEIASFGGMKESGIGREGSKYGIEEFLEVKYLCVGGIER